MMQMVHGLSTKLEEVKDEVRSGNVTLESIAIGELDTPRLVFIQPADVESKSMAKRLASKLKGIAKDKFRLSFLDPVTGVCVPTGNDGLGYIITLPKEWLVKHGKHLRDGLMVVKLACAIGRIAGLPLPDMIGLPKEVVTKAEARAVKAFEELLDNASLMTTDCASDLTASPNKTDRQKAIETCFVIGKSLLFLHPENRVLRKYLKLSLRLRDAQRYP